MIPRIPSSLKWLIDKRARLDAEIKKTEASLHEAKRLIKELKSLKKDLAAIDNALALHEIKVDVSLIRPVRSHYVRINLPHGELTKSILTCLRLNAENDPVPSSEIVSFIAARHADLNAVPELRIKLQESVRYRLRGLYRQGIVKRHHPRDTSYEGLWSLANDGQVDD